MIDSLSTAGAGLGLLGREATERLTAALVAVFVFVFVVVVVVEWGKWEARGRGASGRDWSSLLPLTSFPPFILFIPFIG